MPPNAAFLELRRTEHYLVHEVIAQGGMASVHVGVREGALGFSRVVAVKRLHAQFANDERFVSMLVDEARLVARIRHVNVVSTLDVLEVDREVFVIMEFVRGASLACLLDLTYARDRLVPLPLIGAIMGGALRGLHAAHEATDLEGAPLGIVHRDFSPHNVLVGVSGIPRVIDFGLAHALGKAEATRTGEFKGKLSYAAPEQLSSSSASRRTDVYAAGIVLWELLTGCRLFKAASDLETFRRAATESPAPRIESIWEADARMRAQRSFDEVRGISDVVERALQREPEHRFATAKEMAQALDAVLPNCRASEVGAWVQTLARAELAAEEAIVMRAEEAMARRRRVSREHALVVATTSARASDPELPRSPTPPRTMVGVGPASLPVSTFIAIAVSAAAGAGIGATLFAALQR